MSFAGMAVNFQPCVKAVLESGVSLLDLVARTS